MNETILLSLPQHRIKFYFRYLNWLLVSFLGVVAMIVFPEYRLELAVAALAIALLWFWKETIRHRESVLEITDQRVLLRVKKGLFKSFEVGLHYGQIVNCSYEKSNLFHMLTDSGTLYVRASEKKEGQIVAEFVPQVEQVVQMINRMLPLTPEERKKQGVSGESGTVESEIQRLLTIPGIRDVYELSPDDKRFIFLNEEDRNHGVFEAIRRKHTVCILHTDTFRVPDAPIVYSAEGKVIFPPVPFHEIRRGNAVSGSPSGAIHAHLLKHFPAAEDSDATVLIGFD